MLQLKFADERRPAIALVKSPVRIGRAPDNDVVIDHPGLLLLHAELLIEEGVVIVINRAPDAESYVNDERIVGRRPVRAGDTLRFGQVSLRLDEAQEPRATTIRPAVAAWALAEKNTGRVVALDRPLNVGRLPDCSLSIPEACISRQHARVMIEAGVPVVEDLGSANGTFVNGTRIKRLVLKDGDEVRFDVHAFRVVCLTPAAMTTAPQQAKPATSPAGAEPAATPKPAQEASKPKTPKSEAPKQESRNAEPPKQEKPKIEAAPAVSAAEAPEVKPRRTSWWQRPSKGPRGTVFMSAGELQGTLPASGPQPQSLKAPVLMGLSEVVKGRRIDIRPGVIIVGRGKERDLTIDDTHVSDPHAQIIFEKDTVSVVGFPNCVNGTFVNRVRAGGRVFLQSGDVLSFGGVDFQFWLPGGSKRIVKGSPSGARRRRLDRKFLLLGIVGVLTVAALIAAVLAYL